MANAIKWEAGWTSRSTVLTSQLDSLASGAYSVAGTEIDNSSNLDQYGKLEIYLASFSPFATAYIQVHMITAPGGTNYEDAPASTNPATHTIVASMLVDSTASDDKRIMSNIFPMQPGKTKFVLYNATGAALASSGNTVTLYTANDEIQ